MDDKILIELNDCEFRYLIESEIFGSIFVGCKNKDGKKDIGCDNCGENVHLNCANYNPKKDMCLKWFEEKVSRLTECKEKTTFSDKDLSRKWSN